MFYSILGVNHFGAIPIELSGHEALKENSNLISMQASEHLNLDYRVKKNNLINYFH